ncbi:MAG TPA: helix-turn-helix transcriptional regulator [Gemmatimonadaceae bacterium]|nr:helix-turn-helix transcriptional regulator [Gemmatimonadaceae bacterium]
MNAIKDWVPLLQEARTRAALTQRELARRAGTAQSVVARVERGQTSPTLETLARLLAATGFNLDVELVPRPTADPLIEAFKRDIDRSLLRRNLEKTVDERVRSLQALARLAEEANRAGRVARKKR